MSILNEQKKRMTLVIFKDEGVLSQLQQAQEDRKDGTSTYSDSEEEFAKMLNGLEMKKRLVYIPPNNSFHDFREQK